MNLGDVRCPEAGSQAVIGVVGNSNCFGIVFYGGDGEHWAKDFFLGQSRVFVDVDEDGWLIVGAAGKRAREID